VSGAASFHQVAAERRAVCFAEDDMCVDLRLVIRVGDVADQGQTSTFSLTSRKTSVTSLKGLDRGEMAGIKGMLDTRLQ
jgi:hypothetical protein